MGVNLSKAQWYALFLLVMAPRETIQARYIETDQALRDAMDVLVSKELATRTGDATDHAKRLVSAIHAVLNAAIKAGGSSLRDHRQTDGELGYFQHSFQVYDRESEKCKTAGCGGIVKRFTQNGRSTFWCPKCQK